MMKWKHQKNDFSGDSDVESSLAVLDRVLSEFDDIETDSFFSGDGESPAAAADQLADLEQLEHPPPPPPPVDRSTKPRSSSVAGTPAASWRSSRSGGGDTARSSVGGRRERGSDSPSPSPPGRRASSRVNGLVRSFESSSQESSPPQTVVVSRAQSSVAKPRPGESRPRRSQSETRFGDSVAARRSPPKALRPVGPPPTTRPPPPPPPPGHEPSPPVEQLPPPPPPPPPVVSQPQPTVVSIGNPERSGRSRQRAPSAAAAPPPPPVPPELPPLPTKAALRQKSSPHLTYYPPGDPRRRSLPAREALSGAAPEVSGNIESKIKRLSLNFEPHGPVVLPVRGGLAREELSRAVLAANGRPDHRPQYHALGGSREDRSLDYRHTSAQDLRRDPRDAHTLEQVELQQLDYRSHILPERRQDERLPSVPDSGNHRHASEATYHTVEARTDDTSTRRDQLSDRQSDVIHTRHGVVPSPPEEKERTPSPVETIRSAGAAARTAQRAAQEAAAPGGSLPLRRPSGTLADERARAGPRPVRGSPPAAPVATPAAAAFSPATAAPGPAAAAAAAAADAEEEEASPTSEEQKPSLPAKQLSARNRDERRPPARRKRDRKRKTDEPPPPPEEAQKQISSLLLTRGPGAGDTPTSTLNGSTMRSAASSAATETGTARSTGPRPLRQASVESRLRPSRPAPSPPIHRQASAPSGSLSSRHSDASATTGTRGSQSFRAMPTGSDERRGRGLRRSDETPASRAAAEERVLERDEDGATVGEVTFDLDGSGRTFNYVSYRDGSDGSTPTGPMSLPGSLAMDQPDSPPTNSYPKKMPLFSPIVKDRLNDNTNMYIPAPPSPRPDYYDSELSETDSLTREGSDTEALFGLQEKQKAGKKSSGGRFGATKTSPPMHRKNKVKESKERHQKKKTPEVTTEVKADSKGRSKKASTPPREVTVTHLSPQQETPPSVRQAAAATKSSPPGKQPSPPQKPISLLKRPSLTKQLSQPKKTPAPKPAPAPKQPAARVSSKTSAAPQQPGSQATSVSSQPPAARKSSISSIKQAVRRTSSPKQPPSPSQPPVEEPSPVLPTPPPSPPSPPAQRAPSPPSETPVSAPEAAVSPSSPAEESPAPTSKPAMTPLQAMIEDFHRNLPPPPAFDDADALNVSMDEPPSLAEEVEMEPDDSYYSDDSLDYQDGRSKGAAKRRRRKKSDWSTTTSFDFVHRKEARKRIPEKLTNRDEGISSLESHNSASDDNEGSRRRRQARLIAAAEETPTDSKPARQDSGKQRSKFDSIRKLLKEGRLEGLETPPPDFVPPPPPAVAKSARRPPGRPAGDAPEAPPERETPVKLRPRDSSAGSGGSGQRPRSHSQPASSLVEAAAGRDRSAPSPHEVRPSQSFLSQKGPSSLFVDYRRPSGAGVPTSGTTSSGGGGPPRRRPAPRPDPALRLRAESPLRRNRPVRPTEGVQINPLTHARPGGPPLSPLAGGGAFHSAESLHSSLPPVLRASGGKGGGRGHLTLPGERGLERRDVRRADSLAVSKKEKDGDSKFKFSIFKGFWRRKQYSLEQV